MPGAMSTAMQVYRLCLMSAEADSLGAYGVPTGALSLSQKVPAFGRDILKLIAVLSPEEPPRTIKNKSFSVVIAKPARSPGEQSYLPVLPL